MQIYVKNKAIIDSGNSLAPVGRQAITWTDADLLWIEPLETNFKWVLIKIHKVKVSNVVWASQCQRLRCNAR